MKLLYPSLSCFLIISSMSCQTAPDISAVPLPTEQPVRETMQSVVTPSLAPDSSGKVTTASGLQYRVLSSGAADGRSPTHFDSVIVHYRGTLTDGSVFDSSYDRGQPASFGVGQVIPGWTEALKLMKPGDKWMLFIPSNLAYGSQAVGGKIPPNSDLVFQVELLQVVSGF